MRCSQLEQRLNDVLDRRENPLADDAIAAHVADCGRCRRVTAAYVALADGAAELAGQTRIAAAGRTSLQTAATPRHRTVLRTAAGAAWAVAAGLLVYLSLGPRATDAPVPSSPTSIAVVATLPEAARPATRTASVAELVRHPCRAYVDLVHGTARGVDEAIMLASSLPPPDELLAPVLFPDDGLLKQLGDRWIPAAGETLETLEQVFAAEATVRS
jgi:hypothetical protein